MQRTGRRDHITPCIWVAWWIGIICWEADHMVFERRALYGVTIQMRRTAISVPSNSVEWCVRDSQADYLCFLSIAFGSLRELHYQIRVSKRLGFVMNDDVSLIEPTIIETEKVVNGLIQSLWVGWNTSAFSLQPDHLLRNFKFIKGLYVNLKA